MGNTGTSVELLDTNGTQLCNLPSLPSTRRGHSQTVLTSCGGEDSEYASYTIYPQYGCTQSNILPDGWKMYFFPL